MRTLSSMTGYGTGTAQQGEISVSVEIRSVNHRFLDLHVRLPKEYASLEAEIQQVVRSLVRRGRIDISVSVRSNVSAEVFINRAAVRNYLEAASRLCEEFQLNDRLDLKTLFALPGVLQESQDADNPSSVANALAEAVKASLTEALQAVVQMRHQEGIALSEAMREHLKRLRSSACAIQEHVPASVDEYKQKLESRVTKMLPPNGLDPQRLAQEVAILVDRCDISEELARLASHLDQFEELLNSGCEIGKKLDFLLQEMQREVNTLLSKSGNLEISRSGVGMKSDIEKLREQVQNVE